MTDTLPLDGLTVVNLAVNVPGPCTAARLRDMGATVIKVEPPAGDPLATGAPSWYRELTRDIRIETLDLKSPDDLARLNRGLERTDVFITSHRRSTLHKLGLYDAHLDHPTLCHIEIVGDEAEPNHPGHDLTYQASAGTLVPPAVPRILAGDVSGAERATSAALALLLKRARTGTGGRTVVGLKQTAQAAAASVTHGLTTPDGPLGGGLPTYGLYEVSDGWVAVAALEGHFAKRLAEATGGLDVLTGREALEEFFRDRSLAQVTTWAAEHDLPVAAVT